MLIDPYETLHFMLFILADVVYWAIMHLIKFWFFDYTNTRDMIMWFIPYVFGFIIIFFMFYQYDDVIIEWLKRLVIHFTGG